MEKSGPPLLGARDGFLPRPPALLLPAPLPSRNGRSFALHERRGDAADSSRGALCADSDGLCMDLSVLWAFVTALGGVGDPAIHMSNRCCAASSSARSLAGSHGGSMVCRKSGGAAHASCSAWRSCEAGVSLCVVVTAPVYSPLLPLSPKPL